MRHWLGIFFLFSVLTSSVAQKDSSKNATSTIGLSGIDSSKKDGILIADIQISGNRRTKAGIILREMTIKRGDIISAAELQKQIEISRNQVYNTALFIETNITTSDRTGDIVTIKVEVKERWYLFPVPYFTLADRNFNQWWVTEHRDLSRVNYGIQFTQYNLTGHNDPLNIWLINGYTQQISLRYTLPFFNKSLKHGFDVGYSHLTQKELTESTNYNKQTFIKSNNNLLSFSRADISYSYRPDQHWRHSFRVSFTHESIADTVLFANHNYFPNNKTEFQFIDFTYRIRYLNLDYNAYPTKGYSFDAYIYKRGLDKTTNLWQAGVGGQYVFPVLPKTYFKLAASAIVKSPSNDYFINQQLFGYSNNSSLRGLEYYVIDGDAGAIGQATLFREIFKYKLHTHLNSKNYNQIPFRFFLKMYGDVGYAHSNYPGNSMLTNQLLYTGGIGLDIVSIYDLAFRFEVSFNQLGQHGLFLHAH